MTCAPSSFQASELLPESDAEIEEVTSELIASVSVVSEMLVVATDSEEEAGLLPLDLNSTNSIVLQVKKRLHTTYIEPTKILPTMQPLASVNVCMSLCVFCFLLGIECLGEQCGGRNR